MAIPNLMLKEVYGFERAPSQDQALRCAKAVMIIAGSDGLAAEEMEYVVALARSFGLSEAQIGELSKFDYKKGSLEDYLKDDIRPSARAFLYDAIRVASADARYSDKERNAMRTAAERLGIDAATRVAIEALVEAEAGLRSLRVATLFPPRNK